MPLLESDPDATAIEAALERFEGEFDQLRVDPKRKHDAALAILKLRQQ